MRRYNFANACDKLKELTRGKAGINRASLQSFINTPDIPESEKTPIATTVTGYLHRQVVGIGETD